MYNPTKPYKAATLSAIKLTWDTGKVRIVPDAPYPVLMALHGEPYEIDHTDGIGTKGSGWWKKWKETSDLRNLYGAVLDALAMNLNDLMVCRATPYKLQNHIMIPEDDNDAILKIIEFICYECKNRKIAVTGGETSVMDTLDGLDLSMTVTGYLREIANPIYDDGDILIGLPSSGIHSNGITALRKYLPDGWGTYLVPTMIYDLWPAISSIKAMWHITGGAYTRMKIPGFDVLIERDVFPTWPVFHTIHAAGCSDEDMYRTFNCGVGFVASVAEKDVEKVLARINIEVLGRPTVIGKIVKGTGLVRIESVFSKKEVVL